MPELGQVFILSIVAPIAANNSGPAESRCAVPGTLVGIKMRITSITPTAAMGTGAMGAEVINVTIVSMAAGSVEKEPLKKKLPASFAVGKLKLLCKKVFDLDPDMQTLYYEQGDKRSGTVPTFLDDDAQSLGFFGVYDGMTIYMNEVDLKAVEREKEALRPDPNNCCEIEEK